MRVVIEERLNLLEKEGVRHKYVVVLTFSNKQRTFMNTGTGKKRVSSNSPVGIVSLPLGPEK